jgi:hypothetical protein
MFVESAPIEEALVLRDEAANLASAIERVVTGPSGEPRTRANETAPAPLPAGGGLAYRLVRGVHDHAIRLVAGDGFGSGALACASVLSPECRPSASTRSARPAWK